MRVLDVSGRRFSRIVVSGPGDSDRFGHKRWVCLCDCGNTLTISSTSLLTGNTKSCGCLSEELHTKHGHTKGGNFTREYATWSGMVQRTTNPKNDGYKDYGGRGIKLCNRWRCSFQTFLKDMGPRPVGMTIERINNNKGYYPSNCKWATKSEQLGNRRNTRRSK